MAGLWNIPSLWSCTLVLLTYVYMCNGCTPTLAPSMDAKLRFSDIFLHGKVIEIYDGGYMYDTLYSLKVEVYCIFKGPILDQFINITYAGARHEPGLCISNNFEKDKDYLIFLDQSGDELRPSFNEELYDANLAEDISLYCDIEVINYPLGVDETTSPIQCPEAYPDYDQCIPYVPPSTTAAPDTTTEEAGEVVVKTMSPDDSSKEDTAESWSLEGSGGRLLSSLLVTVLCLMCSVF